MVGEDEARRSSERAPDPLASLSLRVAALFNLLMAALQAVAFWPALGGSGVSLPPLLSQLYRADALGLFFGVTICLAGCFAAASMTSMPGLNARQALRYGLALCLMCVALTCLAYSRELLLFLVGWEVAGVALWIGKRQPLWLVFATHTPALLLVAVLVAGAPYFIPPAGGAVRAWPFAITVAFAVVALARSGCWPFNGWLRLAAEEGKGGTAAVIPCLYALSAPYLLAKALVAAPWPPEGIWLMSLLGSVGLVSAAGSVLVAQGPGRIVGVASAYSAGAIIGFALAPGAPAAAAGAVAFMLSGLLIVSTQATSRASFAPVAGWVGLTGGALGAWCVAAGAVGLNYGIVAVTLLPLGAFPGLCPPSRIDRAGPAWSGGVAAVVVALIGVFPQGALAWVLHPVVDSLAGGVAPLQVATVWPVGIQLNAGEALRAAFPATGIALAIFLCLVALRWLSRLLRLFAASEEPVPSSDPRFWVSDKEVAAPTLTMDDVLPGSEQEGRLLDPSGWLLRVAGNRKPRPPTS